MSTLKRIHIKTVIFFLLLMSVLGYAYFQAQNLLIGPVITISSPPNGATLSSAFVEVTGYTKNISEIHFNDRPIFIDEDGNFKENVLLSPGYTIITVRAEDKFGRKTKKVLELVYN